MLRKIITAAAIFSLGAAVCQPGVAQAQPNNSCAGRVVIDTIYQTGVGGGNHEYFFNLRNATRKTITVDVSMAGFPAGVTLFSPSLPGIPLSAFASRTALKFGRGTWGQVNVGTVSRVYDSGAGSGPTIRLTNCRAG